MTVHAQRCWSRRWLVAALISAAPLGTRTEVAGQIRPERTDGRVPYGEPRTSRYRVGVIVEAAGGSCRNFIAMVAVPLECAEQDVRIVSEDITSGVKSVDYRDLQGGVRQMLVKIPFLQQGAEARALVTFEVRTRPILAPKETRDLRLPRKTERDVKRFLGKSPFIEAGNQRIRKTVREITRDLGEDTPAWESVEAIYDYVQANIQYEEGDDKSAVRTLRDGVGDCYSMSALFVALCRTHKVPARMVWVHNHCYPEFYLEDDTGTGYWFPCQIAGARAFGEMPETRPILQKGDNFKIPERPNELLRYASDWASGSKGRGGAEPRIEFVREAL